MTTYTYRPALVVGTVLATMTAMTMAALPAAAAPAATPLSAPATTVTLITGDQVTVNAHGLSLRPATRGTAFQTYQNAAGDQFVIPSVAQPYLGRQLDPALFDVSALLRNGVRTAGRTPVRLTFASGVTPAAPAGVTITRVAGSTASGYVATTAGSALTAALRKQIGADIAAGHPAGSAPLFDGLTGLSLDENTGEPAAARPFVPLNILQLNATNTTGQPVGTASAFLLNTDSITKTNDVVPIVNGIGRIAVPAGNYTAFGLFDDFDANGNVTEFRAVTLTDFAVASSGTTTAALDERTATSRVSVTTPRPANQDVVVTTFDRVDAVGHTSALSDITFGSLPTFVNAQPRATVGTLRYLVQWGGQPTTEPSNPYRFDVAFGADDIPADESFVVTANEMATVRHHFSADPAGAGGELLNGAVDPHSLFSLSVNNFDTTPVPGDLTQYLGTADGGMWDQVASTANATVFADQRTFAPGQAYSIDWLHGPLIAGFGQHTGAQFCGVCVAGDTLELAFHATDDSVPDHAGFALTAKDHFTLSQNGTVIVDQTGATGAEVPGIPAAPTTFRAVLDHDLTGATGISQSTDTHTDLTVRYQPGAGPALPAQDSCAGQTTATPCAILPALDLNYQLATDETNTSHQRVQVLRLRVGHAGFDGIGSRSPITSADVSVSFDGGTTWQPAPVTGANGSYVATWPNPAPPASPMLKVTAADANGDTVTQTISNAYTVGGQQ